MARTSQDTPTVATEAPDTVIGRPGLSPRSAILIVLYGASLLLIGMGGLVMTFHEVNYAEPAREMMRGGHWLTTSFLGQPFVEKPPLINWSIAAAMAAFHSSGEWVTRIPAAICAVLSALIIGALAARWFGDRIGLYSALIELTSMYVQAQGRRAEPDTMLCAAVSAALAVFALANIERRGENVNRRWMPWAFYLAAGISFLPKGPIGPVLIFAPCAAFALWPRQPRALAFLRNRGGIAIFVVIVAAWPLAVCVTYPAGLASLWREHWARLSGAWTWGKEPALFYLYTTLWVTLPWTPMVLAGAIAMATERAWRQPIWRLLGLWFLAGTIFMSLSPFKHWHYLVPVLPPLSVLAAVGLDRLLMVRWPDYKAGAALTAGVCLIAISAVYLFVRPDAAGAVTMLILAAGIGSLLALYFHRQGSRGIAAASIFATVWVVSVAAQLWVTPHYQTYLGPAMLAKRINDEIPRGSPLYILGPRHDQMVYYLSMPIVPVQETQTLVGRLKRQGAATVYVLGPQSAERTLALIGAVRVLDRSVSIRRGQAESDRLTLMELILAPPAPR